MTMPKGYDLFLSSRQDVKASAVETYMRSSGWVPKAETPVYRDNNDQEAERHPAKTTRNKEARRQKSWVPWPKV